MWKWCAPFSSNISRYKYGIITWVHSNFVLCINSTFVLYCYFNTAANHTFGSIFDVWNAYISTFYPFHLYLKISLYVQMCIHLSDMICFEWKTPMDGKMLVLYVVVRYSIVIQDSYTGVSCSIMYKTLTDIYQCFLLNYSIWIYNIVTLL